MGRSVEKNTHDACQAMTTPVDGSETFTEMIQRRAIVLLRETARKARRLTEGRNSSATTSKTAVETDLLNKGDRVRVRPYQEIKKTLDRRGFTKGCKFMTQMKQYCGEEFLIAGSIEKFFDEARCRTLTCKHLYLLEGVYCDGESVGGCDRSCFLFWRREWLIRIS